MLTAELHYKGDVFSSLRCSLGLSCDRQDHERLYALFHVQSVCQQGSYNGYGSQLQPHPERVELFCSTSLCHGQDEYGWCTQLYEAIGVVVLDERFQAYQVCLQVDHGFEITSE